VVVAGAAVVMATVAGAVVAMVMVAGAVVAAAVVVVAVAKNLMWCVDLLIRSTLFTPQCLQFVTHQNAPHRSQLRPRSQHYARLNRARFDAPLVIPS